MSIGMRIKEAREGKELTRAELATKVGVTPSAVSNYENGISSPKETVLYKLFEALGCDANFLFQDEMEELTIKKEAPINVDESFSKEEILLIKAYRAASDDDRTAVNCILRKYREGGKFDAEFSEHIC